MMSNWAYGEVRAMLFIKDQESFVTKNILNWNNKFITKIKTYTTVKYTFLWKSTINSIEPLGNYE